MLPSSWPVVHRYRTLNLQIVYPRNCRQHLQILGKRHLAILSDFQTMLVRLILGVSSALIPRTQRSFSAFLVFFLCSSVVFSVRSKFFLSRFSDFSGRVTESSRSKKDILKFVSLRTWSLSAVGTENNFTMSRYSTHKKLISVTISYVQHWEHQVMNADRCVTGWVGRMWLLRKHKETTVLSSPELNSITSCFLCRVKGRGDTTGLK